MRGVEVIGPFKGPTGHDRHTRELVRHLVRRGVPVQLTPLNGWSADLPPGVRETWFDGLGAPIESDVALHFAMPTLCRPRAGKANVNYTMFEADRIPQEWIELAAAHERIVVPTEPCRRAWADSGVPEAKLRIAPLGVDGDFFGEPAPPAPILLSNGRPLASYAARFLNIAELRPRKNHLGLLRVWMRATHRSDDAVLILKCTSPHPRALELFRGDIADLQQRLGRSLGDAAPVMFMTDVLADPDLRSLYAAATHYLSLSFGEGWDLPMMESAVAGLQLIAPRHTAYCTYLTDADAELIPATRVPAVIEGRAGAEDRRWFDGTCWWRPDEDAAVDVIARIVLGRHVAKRSPGERIRRDYRWETAAARLHEVLAEL